MNAAEVKYQRRNEYTQRQKEHPVYNMGWIGRERTKVFSLILNLIF